MQLQIFFKVKDIPLLFGPKLRLIILKNYIIIVFFKIFINDLDILIYLNLISN